MHPIGNCKYVTQNYHRRKMFSCSSNCQQLSEAFKLGGLKDADDRANDLCSYITSCFVVEHCGVLKMKFVCYIWQWSGARVGRSRKNKLSASLTVVLVCLCETFDIFSSRYFRRVIHSLCSEKSVKKQFIALLVNPRERFDRKWKVIRSSLSRWSHARVTIYLKAHYQRLIAVFYKYNM